MRISKQKIELLQANRNLTMIAFAERAGVSRQNISTIKGRGTCNPSTASKLAKALGVDVAEIIESEV